MATGHDDKHQGLVLLGATLIAAVLAACATTPPVVPAAPAPVEPHNQLREIAARNRRLAATMLPDCVPLMPVEAAENLLTSTRLIGFSGWGMDDETCAAIAIILDPDSVAILRRVFHTSGTAGQIFALRGLYLRSFSDFAELVGEFEPPEEEVPIHQGCFITRQTPQQALVTLLAEEPALLTDLARAVAAVAERH